MAKKPTRSGKSLIQETSSCSRQIMLSLGFTQQQAARMIKIRHTLPYVENRTTPVIDARKLWELIGKPHGQFNKWWSRNCEGLLDIFVQNSEIESSINISGGRPRIDYHVSRDCAAHLAMMARTSQGQDIRSYFLDMEELAVRLFKRNPVRVDMIVDADKKLTHLAYVNAGNRVRDGLIPKAGIAKEAQKLERSFKSMVCRVLTGLSASEWKERFGRRVRDSLRVTDLELYSSAYSTAVTLLEAGQCLKQIEALLEPSYHQVIDPDSYTSLEVLSSGAAA